MTFCVLHMASERGWRGGEQQVAYLVEELAKREVENILVVKKNSALEKLCREKSWKFQTVSFSNAFDVFSAMAVRKICADLKPNVIHLHTSKAHGVGVLAALLGNKIPMVLSRRVVFKPKDNWLTKWKYNYGGIKTVLCVSDQVTKIMKAVIRKSEKCVTVYPGINLAKFDGIVVNKDYLQQQFGIGPGKFIIGMIGSLSKEKDHYTFIDAIQKVLQSQSNVQAIIIGDGPLEADLKSYANANGLEAHIIFTGYRSDIPQLLKSLDLFLMTSTEEGLGTSLLDAFASRIPVVATAAGGIPEIVIDNKTGMLAPVKDSDVLAKHVVMLMNDAEHRLALVENAWQFVKQFSTQATAEKTLTIYQKEAGKII